MGAPVAFGLGLLPIKDLVDFARESAKKKLEMSTTTETSKGPALSLVQGLNKNVIDRLEEEGITSTVELAYYDPIKLFLKTNFQWAWVIDVMDQAILLNYVGDNIELLRPVGIRGAIEMTVLGEPTRAGASVQQRISNVVAIVCGSRKCHRGRIAQESTTSRSNFFGSVTHEDQAFDIVT